jgi:hypothetical protein
MQFREWPWRRKIAVGAWVPVAVVGFFLFTGPNGSTSGASTEIAPQPKTVTTLKARPPRASVKQLAESFRAYQQTQDDVRYWINANPQRLTLAQQKAKARWRADRQRQLLQKHKAAVASSHHRDQKTAP